MKKAIYSLLGETAYLRASDTYHRLKPLPGFLIIGTQKGGTTSLYNYLTSHPQVLSAARKEVYYFDYNFSETENWYRKYFPLLARVKNYFITGEASPCYLYHMRAAERIAQTADNIKLIVLLRNPADRAISQYWHEVKGGHEKMSIYEAFNKEKERIAEGKKMISTNKNYYSYDYQHFSYVDRGKYAEQIKRYFTHFDRKQMLILKSEDLFCDTQDTFNKVTNFLNLEKYTLQNINPHNVGKYQKNGYSNLRETLADFYKPYNKELYNLLNISPWW